MIVDHPVEREEVEKLLQKRVAFECGDFTDMADVTMGRITGILNIEEYYHVRESKVYSLGLSPFPFRIPLLIKLDSIFRYDGQIFDDGLKELHESFRYAVINITNIEDFKKIITGEKTDDECQLSLVNELELIEKGVSLEGISNQWDKPCGINYDNVISMSKECRLWIIE